MQVLTSLLWSGFSLHCIALSDMAVFVERSRQTLPAFGAASKINADASGGHFYLFLILAIIS